MIEDGDTWRCKEEDESGMKVFDQIWTNLHLYHQNLSIFVEKDEVLRGYYFGGGLSMIFLIGDD